MDKKLSSKCTIKLNRIANVHENRSVSCPREYENKPSLHHNEKRGCLKYFLIHLLDRMI